MHKEKGKIIIHDSVKKESWCYFYKKKGHVKKDFAKYKQQLKKKRISISLVCYEFDMIDICYNTWIDFCSIIHISNTMQAFSKLMETVGNKYCIYTRSKVRSHVKAIGTFGLILSFGFVLDVEKTFHILKIF